MTILAWLAVALGAVVALLLLIVALVLLVPVAVDAAWGDERRAVALAGPGLRIAFDAAAGNGELRVFGWRIWRWSTGPGRRERRRRERRRREGRRRRGARPSVRGLWAQRGCIVRALRAFVRRLRVRRLSLRATLATPDPALTGWLAGAAYAALALTPARVRSGVELRPDFEDEAPRLALEATVRLRPVHAAILGARLWGVTRRARRGRRGGGAGRGRAGSDGRGWPASAAAARARGGDEAEPNRRDGGGRKSR